MPGLVGGLVLRSTEEGCLDEVLAEKLARMVGDARQLE